MKESRDKDLQRSVTESLCEPGPVAGVEDTAMTKTDHDLPLMEITWGRLNYKQVN